MRCFSVLVAVGFALLSVESRAINMFFAGEVSAYAEWSDGPDDWDEQFEDLEINPAGTLLVGAENIVESTTDYSVQNNLGQFLMTLNATVETFDLRPYADGYMAAIFEIFEPAAYSFNGLLEFDSENEFDVFVVEAALFDIGLDADVYYEYKEGAGGFGPSLALNGLEDGLYNDIFGFPQGLLQPGFYAMYFSYVIDLDSDVSSSTGGFSFTLTSVPEGGANFGLLAFSALALGWMRRRSLKAA